MRYLIIILLLLLTLGASRPASAVGGDKTIQGFIKTSAGDDAAGANVSITCNATALNDTTSATGLFQVTFPVEQCDRGDLVTVEASHNGEVGSDTAFASDSSQINFGFIFLAPIAVPEFGLIPGILAALTSGAAFVGLRKKFI